MSQPKWHWLAINGSRFSLGPRPMVAWPVVIPTPSLIVGFQSKEERQQFADDLGRLRDPADVIAFLTMRLTEGLDTGRILARQYDSPVTPVGWDVWVCEAE